MSLIFHSVSTLISLLVDVETWKWPEDERAGWTLADPECSKKWRTDSKSNSLMDLDSSTLDLAPLSDEQLSTSVPTVIYLRESYVKLFERIWSCALTPPAPNMGILVTGQPGTGMFSTTFTMIHKILIMFSRDYSYTTFLFAFCKRSKLYSSLQLLLFYHDLVFGAKADRNLILPTTKSPSLITILFGLYSTFLLKLSHNGRC